MAKQAQEAMGARELTAIADRGYFKGEEMLERDVMRSNQARHCERSEAIQGMKGRSGSSGSPRRFAPRDDDSIRPHLALACEAAGVTPIVPKPLTSGAKADGRFGKQDFVYDPQEDAYRCPGREKLTRRFTTVEAGLTLHAYWTTKCAPLRAQIEMHAFKEAARQALGTRSRPRHDAGAVGPCAPEHAHPTPDRRTSIRNHQGLDGRHPLPATHP